MRNNLYEISVAPKNPGQQKTFLLIFNILKYLNLAVIGVCLVIAFSIYNLFYIVALLFVLSYILCLRISRMFYNFYDYTFVDGSIRIIKVVNNKMRRLVIKFDAKDIISVGNLFGETYNKRIKDKTVKNLFASPNPLTENDIAIYLSSGGKEYLLMLEYDEFFIVNVLRSSGINKLDKDFADKIKSENNG